MNYKEINIEIIKCLSDKWENVVRAQRLDDDEILIIPSPAYYGYIIPRKELMVEESRLSFLPLEKPLFKISDYCKPENMVKPTNQFIRYGTFLCQRFEGKMKKQTWGVYINEKYLKQVNRDGCEFYQNVKPGKDMPRENILAVKHEMTDDGKDIYKPLLYIMPVEIRDRK